eukprot:PLAT3282.13.p1 GENE.PLAT3282.13~~PLAT3282.13.p1  ORF type:complete len:541 (+),score=132.24 PLAT3282.13:163-1785(+)
MPHSSRVVPLRAGDGAMGSSLPQIYCSQLALLPLMVLTALVGLLVLRLASAGDDAASSVGLCISGAIGYLPLLAIPAWIYQSVAPGVYTNRTLLKLLTPLALLLASLRAARQVLSGSPIARSLPYSSPNKLLLDGIQLAFTLMHSSSVLLLPFSFSTLSLRTPLVRFQLPGAEEKLLHTSSSAVSWLLTPLIVVLYGYTLLRFFSGVALGAVAFSSPIIMQIAILLDRRKPETGWKSAFYALTAGFNGLALSTGAGELISLVVPYSRRLPLVLRTPAALVFFAILFSVLRRQWMWIVKRLLKDPQLWSPLLFGLQLIEDLMMEVLYVGVAVNSASFWVVLFFSILKQVLRDSFLVHLGWVRLKGIITGHKVTLQQQRAHLANSWRVLEQNLASELLSACVLPIMLLLDLMYREAGVPGDDVVIASMPTASAVVEQVGAYVLLLCGELAVHAITHWLILSRVAALQEPSAVYAAGDVEDAKSESGVKGEGASGSWTLTVEGYRCETAAYWAQHRWMLSVIAVATTWEITTRFSAAVAAVTR